MQAQKSLMKSRVTSAASSLIINYILVSFGGTAYYDFLILFYVSYQEHYIYIICIY